MQLPPAAEGSRASPSPFHVLRPLLLVQLLPASPDHTQQRLAAVQQELAALQEQQQAIGRRARWRQAAFVWGGLGSQVGDGSAGAAS